jgi:hypothetical protein
MTHDTLLSEKNRSIIYPFLSIQIFRLLSEEDTRAEVQVGGPKTHKSERRGPTQTNLVYCEGNYNVPSCVGTGTEPYGGAATHQAG